MENLNNYDNYDIDEQYSDVEYTKTDLKNQKHALILLKLKSINK